MSEPGPPGDSAAATNESDAFISYSHRDRAFAVRLRDALRDAGLRPWLDETEISGGTRWSDALERAIQHADAFVFLLSPDSAGSRECRRELDYALELNKRILPVRIAETPAEAMPPRLAEYQFIPSRALFGADFAACTQQLITEIETDREWVREHTDWSEKASEWDRHDRNRSYLLSGVELSGAERWRSGAAGKRPGLSTLQSQFIDASREHATSRLRRTRGAVSVALAVALGLAALALVLRQQAISESHTARSRQLAAESLLHLSSDPQVALKLAIASADVKHTSDALNALRAAIPQNHMLHELSAGDGKPLIDARWSDDGSMVVTTSLDNQVRVYSAASGQPLHRFPAPGLASREPGGAFFIDHDREVLIWGPGYVRSFSLATGKRVLSLSDDTFTELEDVVENPQGTMIATASGPQLTAGVELWSTQTGRRLHTLIREGAAIPNTEVPQQVAFSPNGELLAGGTQFGTALVWNAHTGGFVRQLNLADSRTYPEVNVVAFSPDGTRLATEQEPASAAGGRTVLWDVSDWHSSGFVPGLQPVWSTGGSFLSTTLDGDVPIWRLGSLKHWWAKAAGFDAPATIPPALGRGDVGRPGDLVIPSTDGSATVWDTYTGDTIERLAGDSGSIATAGFSPDGARILTWSSDGSARIWETGQITSVAGPYPPAVARAASAAGSIRNNLGLGLPTDPLTPVAYYSTDNSSSANRLIVFDSRTGRRLADARVGAGPPIVTFDRAGDLMLVTGVDAARKSIYGPAQIRRTHGGALLRAVPAPVAAGYLSPDGKLAAAVSPNDDVTIWDVASGRRLAVFRGERAKPAVKYPGPVSVSFSPDSSLVLTSNSDARSFVWRPRTGRVVAEMKGDPEPSVGMYSGITGAISPNDKLVVLASGWDNDASVYTLGSSTPLVSLIGNPGGVMNVALSPDSQLIATVDDSDPGRINVYDTSGQQPLLTIDGAKGEMAAFSRTGDRLITSEQEELPNEIYTCAICGGFDQLLATAHQRAIGRLTSQERSLYLR